MNQNSKQIRLGAVISYMALIVNIVATLIYVPWMVSIIGKSNYALYTLAYSFISIFLIDFGLSSSVSKFVAQYRAEGDIQKEKEFLATVFRAYIVLDAIIGIIFVATFFFLEDIYIGLTPMEMETFRWLYLIVASFSIISFLFTPLTGIMYAYEKLIELKLCELFQKLFSIALVVVALCVKANVVFVVLANVLSAVFTIVIKIGIIRKKTGVSIQLSLANPTMLKRVAGFTVWVAIQALAQRCIFTLAPTILGMVATSEDIALFAPASSIEGYFATVAAAIHGFFVMRITQYVIEDRKEEIYRLMLKVGRYQVLLLGLIYVVFLCVGKDFVCAWMGDEFIKAFPCTLLLLFPDILIFSCQVATTALTAKDVVKEQSVGYILMAVVCVGLSFPLSKFYGVIGASIAIAVSYAVLFVYNMSLYTKKLRLDMRRFVRECYWALLAPIAFTAVIGAMICRLIPLHGWIAVCLKSIVVITIYILLVFKKLNEDEKKMVRAVFKRVRRKN